MTPKDETQKLYNWGIMWLNSSNFMYLNYDTVQKLVFIIMILVIKNKDKKPG